MQAKFIKGQDSKTALNIGENRIIKKDEHFKVHYKSELMDVIALDDEEVTKDGNYVDFIDSDGGICWATQNKKTGKWWVPSDFSNKL